MEIKPLPDLSGLSQTEKEKIVNKLLIDTFQAFMGTFYSLGYTQKIWGKFTNPVTDETFEIEFKKNQRKNEFGL